MQVGRSGRELESGAIASLVPLITITPVWLATMAGLWWVSRGLTGLSFWQLAIGYAAAGILLFLRPFQRLILLPVLGCRRANADELAVLLPVWREVTQVARQPAGRYELCVLPYHEINAFASGGSLVAVTSSAVEMLPDDELAGVLAHELSHHLGLHTIALTLAQWLSVPVVLLARAGFWLHSVAQAATDTFARRSEGLTIIGSIAAAVLRGVASVLRLGLVAANALGNAVGRGSEFQADSRAVSLGYGPHLAAALRRFVDAEGSVLSRTWQERMFAVHPPARTRIARIDALVRQQRNDGRRDERPDEWPDGQPVRRPGRRP